MGEKGKRKNLEDRLFDFLDKDVHRLEKKIDDNTKLTQATKEQAEKTNGRVNINDKRIKVLEDKVLGPSNVKESSPEKLPPFWKDARTMRTIINIVFILAMGFLILIIAATSSNVDAGKVIDLIR